MSIELEISTGVVVSIAALLLALLNFLYQRLKVNVDLENRLTKLESKEDLCGKVDNILNRLVSIEVKNDLVWHSVEQSITDILHHPDTPRQDELLEKLKYNDIHLIELRELEDLLTKTIVINKGKEKNVIPESVAAVLLLARVKQRIFDCKNKSGH